MNGQSRIGSAPRAPRAAAIALATLALATLALATGTAAAAQQPASGFSAAESAVLGGEASGSWRSALFGGAGRTEGGGDNVPDEFGTGKKAADGEEAPDDAGGSDDLGRKFKAGTLSAILPGAGQYYNGEHEQAYIMAGIEVGIWTTYFIFDNQGDGSMESAREWSGIYAGTDGDHDDSYWQSVGQYMDSDAYNEDRYREARATQEPVSGLVGPDDAWQWVNEDRRYGYATLRADGNSAYDRRDFMILFAVLNRAVSVFDAVVGVGGDDGIAQAHVLGMDVGFEISPALKDPGARCVVSRGF